ncbi:MAG: Carboxylate--amine ligase [Nitrosopumilus sp.]|nr:Carboxylate--amine ligase [Candidatus Nitrosopumilus limneticus]
MISSEITIKEFKKFDLEEGYLIDGFPSVGFSSAIATESMIYTSQFELAGIIDSKIFPPISVIKGGKPNYPSRIFINENLKVAVFSSYLNLDQTLHREVSELMLEWSKKHKIKLIVSSVAVKSEKENSKMMGVGSTDAARKKIEESGLKVLENGTIPGIPGMLLNEGSITNQDVIVIVFNTSGNGPDFKSSAELCMAMSKLIPGASCDIPSLLKEAQKAEATIKETQEESTNLKESMYR